MSNPFVQMQIDTKKDLATIEALRAELAAARAEVERLASVIDTCRAVGVEVTTLEGTTSVTNTRAVTAEAELVRAEAWRVAAVSEIRDLRTLGSALATAVEGTTPTTDGGEPCWCSRPRGHSGICLERREALAAWRKRR